MQNEYEIKIIFTSFLSAQFDIFKFSSEFNDFNLNIDISIGLLKLVVITLVVNIIKTTQIILMDIVIEFYLETLLCFKNECEILKRIKFPKSSHIYKDL